MRLALSELDEIAPGLPYRERTRGGPSWLTSALAASPAARERLRAYFASGAPPAPSYREVLSGLHVYGDESLLERLVGYVVQLPPPVVRHVLEHVTFILIGARSIGMCFSARLRPRDQACLVSSRGAADPMFGSVALHEIAHAWTFPLVEDLEPETALISWAFSSATPAEREQHAQQFSERARQSRDRERQANTLTREWSTLFASGGDR